MIKKSSFEGVKVNIPVRVRYTANYKTALTGFDREIDGDAIELIGDKLHVYCDILGYKTIVDIKTITLLICFSGGIHDKDYYLFLDIHNHIFNNKVKTNNMVKTNKMKKFWFIVGIILSIISLIMIINKHVCNNDNVIKTLPTTNDTVTTVSPASEENVKIVIPK